MSAAEDAARRAGLLPGGDAAPSGPSRAEEAAMRAGLLPSTDRTVGDVEAEVAANAAQGWRDTTLPSENQLQAIREDAQRQKGDAFLAKVVPLAASAAVTGAAAPIVGTGLLANAALGAGAYSGTKALENLFSGDPVFSGIDPLSLTESAITGGVMGPVTTASSAAKAALAAGVAGAGVNMLENYRAGLPLLDDTGKAAAGAALLGGVANRYWGRPAQTLAREIPRPYDMPPLSVEALGFDRPLPEVAPATMAARLAQQPATLQLEADAAKAADPNALNIVPQLKNAFSFGTDKMIASDDPIASTLGQLMRGKEMRERRLAEYLDRARAGILGGLDPDQQEQLRLLSHQIAQGEASVADVPQELQPAYGQWSDLRGRISQMLSDAGVTHWVNGEARPFIPRTDFGWPVRREMTPAIASRAATLAQNQGMDWDQAVSAAMSTQSGTGRYTVAGRTLDALIPTADAAPRLSPADELGKYFEDVARWYSTTSTLGPLDPTLRIGTKAAELYPLIEDPALRQYAEGVLGRMYRGTPDLTGTPKLVSSLMQGASRPALVFSFLKQPQQLASVFAKYGLGNFLSAPTALRDLARETGAGEAGLANYLAGGSHASLNDNRYRLLRGIERLMREDVAAPAAGQQFLKLSEALAGGDTGSVMQRRLGEFGTSIPEVLNAISSGGGSISMTDPVGRSLLMDVMQRGADSALLQNGLTDLPLISHDPVARALMQWKGFGMGQSKLFSRDFVAPLVEGIRQRDPALAYLGASRLAKLGGYGIALGAPTYLASSLASGRIPGPLDALTQLAGATGGTLYGDIPMAAINNAYSPFRYDDPIEANSAIPFLAPAHQIYRGVVRGGEHLVGGDIPSAGLDLIAAGLRAGMYRDPTGNYSFVAKPAAGYLDQLSRLLSAK